MNLYDDSTAVASAPALPAAVSPGYYTDGVVGSVPRSIIRAWHLNAMQQEIVNAIRSAGLTPNRAINNQLFLAIQALVAAGAIAFTPVQQGGGPGQAGTKLNLGWDGAQLLLAVGGAAEGAIALKTDVTAAITALIGGAPGALETLKELADAINDDASFAATITAALGLKAPLASPALTGNPTVPTQAAGDNSTKAASTGYADRAVATAVTGLSPHGNLSSNNGPWWTWNPVTGEVHVRGVYGSVITSEGTIAITFPVNIGAFRGAQTTIIQNSQSDNTTADIDSATPPTSTGMTVRINDNVGGSGASAQGFYWDAWGYSATAPG